MTPAIKVVVINFNAGEALLKCIASLLASTEHASIVVADNASSDASDQVLRSRYGHLDNLEVLNNPANLGFARAVNGVVIGVSNGVVSSAVKGAGAAVKEPFVLILNPDCEVEPDALSRLKSALEDDPGAALAGPCVLSTGQKVEKSALRRFPDPWRSLMSLSGLSRLSRFSKAVQGIEQPLPGSVVQAEAVSGACMLVRRSSFEAVGGMDEAYAMHCEDLDLMYRLHQAGHHCLFVPQARVRHLNGLSSKSRPWWVHRHKHLGMQRFYRKFQASGHIPPLRWIVYCGIWLHYLITVPVVLARR